MASIAVGQDDQVKSDAYIDQMKSSSFMGSPKVIQDNDLILIQAGAENLAQVVQSQGQEGAHAANIWQYGVQEVIMLNQSGANNQAALLQYGSNNNISVAQKGNFISSVVIQDGWNNSVVQELGADEASFTVIQYGANWSLIDTGFNPDSPGYSIKQSGLAGVPVTVKHH